MKIRTQESQDLVTALQHYGKGREEVKIWKKKGWVHIKIIDHQEIFSFHRKDEVRLIDNKFVPEVSYQMSVNATSHSNLRWEEVLVQFRQWIKKNAEGKPIAKNPDQEPT